MHKAFFNSNLGHIYAKDLFQNTYNKLSEFYV